MGWIHILSPPKVYSMKTLNIGHTFPNGTRVLEVIDADSQHYNITTKFIGYTEQGEFIIATLAEGDAYIWTTYAKSLAGVIDAHRYKNRADSREAILERLDGALSEAVDELQSDDFDWLSDMVTQQAEELRGVINA